MATTINIIDRATPQLNALIRRVQNPAPGLMVAGRAVANLLKQHFQHKNDTEPNKLGGDRTNFWLGMKRAVNQPQQTGAAEVQVSISHPAILQKIKGGQIVAKRGEFLTIPIAPESHGRRASVLASTLGIRLFRVVLKRDGRIFLAGRKSGEGIKFYYRLKKEVNQASDPSALPPEEQLRDTATKTFGDWVVSDQT